MDGSKPLSLGVKLEVDQAQSVKNIQKAVNDIGKQTTMKVDGLKIDFSSFAKDFNKFISQSFKVGKDNNLTGMTTQLMNQYGEILTIQHKVLENGTTEIQQANIKADALKVQKQRYEEIRQLYEKVGKLQAGSVTASQKKKESIKEEVKETQKLIKQKEKALKAEGLTNDSLQNSTINKQKLANTKLLAQEEEKLAKKRESAYTRLQKSLELIHKYNMQSLTANKHELEVLEKKKAVATSTRNSVQGLINRSGLGDDNYNTQITKLKEIQALEYQSKQNTLEEVKLNKELEASETRLLKLKKQYESSTDGNVKTTLNEQIVKQELAIAQQKQAIEQKGLSYQQTENALKQKQLDFENQIAVVQAKQLSNTERERKEIETLIARTQKSMRMDINKSLAKNSKYITTEDLVAIEKFQQKLKQLDGTSLKGVRNEIADLKLDWKEINSTIEVNKLKQTSTAMGELGESFKKMATYVSGAMVVRQLWAELQTGLTHIKEVDQAFTNMSMTMTSLTEDKFSDMVKQVNTMSKEMGAVSSEVLKIAQTFANDSVTIEQVMDKLSASTALMNVSGMGATEVTKSVMSVANSYQLLSEGGENAAEVTEYLGDVLSKVSANMDMDFQEGLQGLVSGIGVAGSTMKAAGVDMEWFAGMLGNAMVATGQSSDKLGRAMRTITARVMQQKQALEELGESTENIELEFAQGERALKQLGITIRDDASGELKSFSSIMDELGGKWENLSDSTKYFLAEQLAGKNQMDVFIGMMDSYDNAMELVNGAYQAQGTLMDMNSTYAESLEGKLNTLKSAQQELYQTFVNTDGYKAMIDSFTGIINGATALVDTFGAMPLVITGATTGFMSFTNAGKLMSQSLLDMAGKYSSTIQGVIDLRDEQKLLIETTKLNIATIESDIAERQRQGESVVDLVDNLKLENKTLKATELQLVATTIKTVALQTAMSLGLSLAISAVVGGLTSLMSNLSSSNVSMKELAESTQELKESMEVDASGLLSEYERLTKLAETEGKTQKEIKYYNDEIAKVRSELVNIDSAYAGILDDETKTLETQLSLIKQQAQLRQQEQAKELDKGLGWDWTHNNRVNGLEATLQLQYEGLLKYKELYDQIKNSDVETVINPLTNTEQSVENFLKVFEKLRENFKETYAEASQINDTLKTIGETGYESGKNLVSYGEEMTNMFNSLGKDSLDAVGASAEELATTYQSTEEKILALTTTFKGLQNEQFKYADTIQDIRATIQECGATVGAQEEIVRQFTDVFPELEGAVEGVDDVLAVLGDKATIELGKAQEQARSFLETMQDSENYTSDFVEQLLSAYPELHGHIQDTAYVQEFLNEKIGEMDDLYGMVMSQVDVHRTAQEEILANDANFWNEKMKNSQNFLQYQSAIESKLIQLGADSLGIQYDDFARFIDSKGGLREIDYTNATTLAEAEDMTEAQKLQSMLKMYAQYVNEKDGFRSTDSQLIKEFLNWQGEAEATTVDELKTMWAEFYNIKKAEIQRDLDKLSGLMDASAGAYNDLGNIDPAQMKQWHDLRNQINAMNKITQQMNSGSLFNTIKTTFTGSGIGSYKGSSLGNSGLNTNGSSSNKDNEKVVEDLDLQIDRYYELNDALDDVNNALELNRKLQSMSDNVTKTKDLHKEEIDLLNQKLEALKKLQAEQRMDLTQQKNTLLSAGFKFDKEGNITNYSSQLKAMESYANSLKGDAKESQKEYVQSIMGIIDAYTSLSNDTLPSTEVAIEELQNEIKNINKEHEKTLKLIETLGDRYYTINNLINDVDNKLSLNQAKQQNANASEKVKLMEEEIALMKEKQKLLKEQGSQLQVEADELAKKLVDKGVKFNNDGTVANYEDLVKNYKTIANMKIGEAREEEIEQAQEIIDLIEQYDEIIRNTLPELEVKWEEYATSIRESEKAMAEQVTQVQKDVTSAIENEMRKRTEAVKTELQKQKDAYNKQFEEEDWEDSLSAEQRKLDEIQQAINNMSRDTSLAGQLKLQQLKDEYLAQQKVIDDMIRDKEKENGNARFDEEMKKAEQEMEEALKPENIAQLVNQALVDGFVTIGDEVLALDDVMTTWLKDTGDGLYAIGDTLREELIDNLRVAQELMAGMGVTQLGVNSTVDQNSILKDLEEKLQANLTTGTDVKTGQKLDITIGSLLEVQGSVTEDVLPKLESMISHAKEELIDEIASELMKR